TRLPLPRAQCRGCRAPQPRAEEGVRGDAGARAAGPAGLQVGGGHRPGGAGGGEHAQGAPREGVAAGAPAVPHEGAAGAGGEEEGPAV
ncbi:unnamed protein product, partial [Prorocentrum cordatum]